MSATSSASSGAPLRCSGPQTALTLADGIERVLYPGVEYDLDPADPVVQELQALGRFAAAVVVGLPLPREAPVVSPSTSAPRARSAARASRQES